MAIRRAVIDVGTNSVKLLVADVAGASAEPVWEASRQTRLGEGFYDTGRLQAEPIQKTAAAVAEYVHKARSLGAAEIQVIATSAAREASNARDLELSIDQAAGLKLRIISGNQEAEWAFAGVTAHPTFQRRALLLLDVGGGSTEFILGGDKAVHFRQSFHLGTVRLLEHLPHTDPPTRPEMDQCRQWVKTFLDSEVRPLLEPAIKREQQVNPQPPILVGTGGTATILARMEAQLEDWNRDKIEAVRLDRDHMHWHVEKLWSLSLVERKQITGLPPNRADIILTGVIIYQSILDEFGFEELRISTYGLRFGAVLEPGQPLRQDPVGA